MSEETELQPAVIIDTGSFTLKVGFSTDNKPSVIERCIRGDPKCDTYMVGMATKIPFEYWGSIAWEKRGLLDIRYAVNKGVIQKWDDIEYLWHCCAHYSGTDFHADFEEHPLLITDSISSNKDTRQKFVQIMFESFNVPKGYILNEALAAITTSGKLNGIVIDSGYERTTCVPIYNGQCIKDSIISLDFGGKNVRDYLIKLRGNESLTNEVKKIRSYDVKDASDLCELVLPDIGYVAKDYNDEQNNFKDFEYVLPDGYKMKFGDEAYKCAELIFNPNLNGLDSDGIVDAIVGCVMKCDSNLRMDLLANIVLSGGNMNFKGINDRLLNELRLMPIENDLVNGYVRYNYGKYNENKLLCDGVMNLMCKYSSNVNICNCESLQYTTWIGGAIYANNLKDDDWISHEEYDENGPSIADRKLRNTEV